MATLITGASGLIGNALARDLARDHDVVCMSRRDPAIGLPFVQGAFTNSDDLAKLDAHDIDSVVHLGGVTGGCPEIDGMLVNVEGTRLLLRYLIDRGVANIVAASSIALIGIQRTDLKPESLPVADEHGCQDKDGYGFSKYMMEEVLRYYARQCPELDIIALRLASVPPPEQMPGDLLDICPPPPWTLGHVTRMHLSDAVRAFRWALDAPPKPGLRIMNATGPEAWVTCTSAQLARAWFGDDIDLTHYEQPGNAYAGFYDVTKIKDELGFVAEILPQR